MCYIFECKIFNNTFDVWLRQGLNIYSVSWLVQGNSTFPLNCNVPLAVSIFAEVKFMHRYEIFTIFFFFFDISNKNWDFTFCILRSYAMIEWWNLIINKRMNRRGLNLEYKKWLCVCHRPQNISPILISTTSICRISQHCQGYIWL